MVVIFSVYPDGLISVLLRLLVTGNTSDTESKHSNISYSSVIQSSDSGFKTALQLVTCNVGLQISFLTLDVLQKKIFTEYINSEGHVEKYNDSEFLVFMNYSLGFIFSGICLLIKQQSIHQTPLYKYSYCSLSNILSSWCQYEALKLVSFSSQVFDSFKITVYNMLFDFSFLFQVLSKFTKIIPVILIGKLISKTKYKSYEYFTAFFISIGMTIFLLGSMKNEGSTPISFWANHLN